MGCNYSSMPWHQRRSSVIVRHWSVIASHRKNLSGQTIITYLPYNRKYNHSKTQHTNIWTFLGSTRWKTDVCSQHHNIARHTGIVYGRWPTMHWQGYHQVYIVFIWLFQCFINLGLTHDLFLCEHYTLMPFDAFTLVNNTLYLMGWVVLSSYFQ